MAKAGYSIVTGGAVPLTATTPKSVLGIKSHANFGLDLKKIHFGFLGTTNTVPVVVELCAATFATNSPGTASTSVTPVQVYGRSIAVGATAAKTWTAEPTVLTVIDEWPVTPNGGLALYDLPLGDTYDCAVSEGWVLRCTAPDATSVRASMKYERC